MKYSESFGKSSSKILLGTAYFGETISEKDSFDIMDKYYSLGGRHIDTARLYAEGESEKVIGKWLRERRYDDIFLSTKGGFQKAADLPVSRLSEGELRSDLGKSLDALGIEQIEFYWLHRDDERLSVSEIITTMNKFVSEGKIKKFGASNWKINRIEEANNYAKENGLMGFCASQIRFSPAIIAPGGNADRTLVDMDKEGFYYYADKKMPVAAYASQGKGFFSKMASLGEAGLSDKSKERYLCEENLRRLEMIKALSDKYNISIASCVCAILSSAKSVDVFPIIGGSKVSQIEDSMVGADITLEESEVKGILGFC
ncbi:MAG: aldo/keto reductase [Clostridia bacterium]|nr:aldo/keto reductase [Clostridia bacterium]